MTSSALPHPSSSQSQEVLAWWIERKRQLARQRRWPPRLSLPTVRNEAILAGPQLV